MSRNPDFAARFQQRLPYAEGVPDKEHGRLTWLVRRMQNDGVKVTIESIRKWKAGDTRPRGDRLTALAKILGVEPEWLILGDLSGTTKNELDDGQESLNMNNQPAESSYFTPRNKISAGAYFVAGILMLGGGSVAFPSADDDYARRIKADLYMIRDDEQIQIHVTEMVATGKNTFLIKLPKSATTTHVVAISKQDGQGPIAYQIPRSILQLNGEDKHQTTQTLAEMSHRRTLKIGSHQIDPMTSLSSITA